MSNFARNFLNNLAPPSLCILCGADSSNGAFCAACLAALPWLPINHCPHCARPTPDGGLCGACLKAPPAFDSIHAALLYTGALAQLVPAAKFGGRWSLLPALAQLILPTVQAAPRPDLLIAMPLHPKRLKERGYNQAQEIAAPLARALHLPLEHDLLIRSRDTEHQARLTGKARRDNMRNAFSVHGDLTSRHVAVIDDVMTTGASLQAAAKALKQAGAARVDGWVLARTA